MNYACECSDVIVGWIDAVGCAPPLVTSHLARKRRQWLNIAEDNAVGRHMVVRMLKKQGHTFTAVAAD